ncbi:hypothetical protein [Amycolatopsis granulosa]|uniref:hypothetical protein n=1 Tax=Amycolatopsis granulosa TaxID=185684 RepID=UPI0014228627|nr:hypothetical protein [Amycolatopsis granulosa]NIH86382.1 hypothetical protein [Amycolatopsis granulosa]
MTASRGQLPEELAGRLLTYTNYKWLDVAISATGRSSGLVAAGPGCRPGLRRLRSTKDSGPLVYDERRWAAELASPSSPLGLPSGDGLFEITLDQWVAGVVADGVGGVLTPSKFVASADWPTLRALVAAANEVTSPRAITLVATDAAMLDPEQLGTFIDVVSRSVKPLAFVFAAKRRPLGSAGRVAGLRALLAAVPGSLLLATEVLAALDGLTRGAAAAAIGLTGGLRRPARPDDVTGGGFSNGALPGLFLRELCEHRSPMTYADWYANSPSPRCGRCGGRALDSFAGTDQDRRAILRHNVHTWLAMWDELHPLRREEQQQALAEELRTAFSRHARLRLGNVRLEVDPLLRQLVELDDPEQRSATRAGSWH